MGPCLPLLRLSPYLNLPSEGLSRDGCSGGDGAYLERANPIDTGLSLGHKVWAGGPFLSCCLNKDSGINLAFPVTGVVCRGGRHESGISGRECLGNVALFI